MKFMGVAAMITIICRVSVAASVDHLGDNKLGKPFPNRARIDLSQPGNDPISPLDLLGRPGAKRVFVAYFQETCVPCMAEISQLWTDRARLREKGVEVLLVGVQQERSKVRALIKAKGWEFPVIADSYEGEYSHASGVFQKMPDGTEQVILPTAVLLRKGGDGLVLDAAWQGGETEIVGKILEKVK